MNNSRVPPLSVNPNAFNDLMEFGRQDVNARANQIREELKALQTVRQAQAQAEEQNKDSLVSRLNLSPGTRDANAVNLGASIVASGARLGGHILSWPSQIAAIHSEAHLNQEHFEAYRRMKEGRASDRDMLVLSSSTYHDGRMNSPTIQQSIEYAMRNRAAGRDIVEAATSVGRLVHQGNREQLIEDGDRGFDDQWERVKEGWRQLGVGQDREGWTNITSGIGRIIANAGVSAYNNPAGAFEYVAEVIPQIALGLSGRAGMALLTTSNIGYAVDEYSKGIQKYQEENNGAMPSPEQQERMATHAVSLVLAEQLSDVVQLRGIRKILGTTDDAVKAGFKQTLRNYATSVPKAIAVEGLTEGWQTYAEGEANLEGSTAKDIYRGAFIGSLAGGGVAAVSPALAVVGAAKDMHSQYKEARNKAEETLKRNEADRARVAEAEKTGDVSVFLNRADRKNYDPSLALEVLFRQDTSNYTTEQKQARQAQIRQIINSFERDVAVRQAAMQRGDSPELQAELAELRQEAQDYPNDPSIQEDIAALQAKMQAPPLEPKELQALQQEVADIQPKLEKARSIYQQLLNEQTGQREINTNVDESVQAVKDAADVAAAAPAVGNIRILSMASPGVVSTQQAQALLNSGKLSQDDIKYFRLYINAETSLNQAKNMKQVSREVMEGDPQQRQKGLATYRKNVASFLADGNKYLARREMAGLVRFIDSHSAKLGAMNAALESSKQTGRTYHIFKDESGEWQSKELPEGTKNFKRKKGEYLIDARSSQQMVAAVSQELQAMADTQLLLDSQINQVNAEGANNATTLSEDNTTTNSNATSGDTGGIEASSQESGIGTNEGAATATEAQSNDVTPTVVANPDDNIPRVQVGEDPDGWLNQNAQLARTQSDNAGLTAEIEGYFAKGMTARQALNEVKSRLTFVDPHEQKSWIVGVRATLGIPSQMDTDGQLEFAQWQNEYNQRQANKLKNARQPSTNQTQPTNTPQETAAPEIAQETTEAGEITESTASPEGSTEQSVESESASLSLFESLDENLAIARDTLTQRAGREGGTQRPLVKVKNFLYSLVSGTESASSYLKDALTSEQQNTLRKFLQLAPVWNAAITKLLPTQLKTEYSWKNVAEFLMANTYGQIDFDENVKTAMTAAAMAWVSDFYRQGLFNDDRAINQLLGREENHEVSPEERRLLASVGVRRATAANALGRRVVEALGLKAKKSAPQNLMVNLEATLGTYAMQLLVDQNVLENNPPITQEQWVAMTGQTPNPDFEFAKQDFVRLARVKGNQKEVNEKVRWVLDATKGSQNLLEKLFSVEDRATFPTMEPVPYAQNRVKKGITRIPKKLAEALKKKNQEPNFLRINMYEIISVMSPDLFLQIAGVKVVDDNTMHINNRRSQEAKNDGLERDYWNIREFIETTWSDAGLELPIFLQHVAWKNQRVGIENTVLNPQTSKIARHLLTRETWRTEVNPTNSTSFDNFKLRVLEGFGVKTDKQSNEKSLQQWESTVNNDVVKAGVDALVYLRSNRGSELSLEQQQAIASAVAKGGENMKTLDALNALADLKMWEQQPEGVDKKATFTTELVGEVDGVTNGPMLTNLLMGAASIPGLLFQLINKGGFFQQEAGFENYNVYRGSDGVMDLYESTTKLVLDAIRPKAKTPDFEAIWAFTGAMEDGEGKVVKAGRNIIKRPITALHFGSAPSKAVDGMADDFVQAVFKQIEKYHQEGRDVSGLVKHLNNMMGLKGDKAIPANIPSSELMNLEFKEAQINRLKKHFNDHMGKPTIKVLKTQFESVMERKRSINGTAGLLFGMYNAVYQSMRQEYLNELVQSGVMDVDAKGNPKWDLSQEQEAEIEKRIKKLRPLLGTAMSQLSRDVGSGLSISKTQQQLSNNHLHRSRVQFNKANVGQASMMVSGQTLVKQGPGVAPFSMSIHSFDSAVSHMAALLSEALNIHDAHVTGLGNFQQVAQNLNKALWDMALQYSPAQAMYESAERQIKTMAQLLADPSTPNSVRAALKKQLEAEIAQYNEAKVKYKKPEEVFTGTPAEYLLMKLKDAKTEAYLADQVRLGALAEMAFVDQYALEGGQYTVTDKDRQEAKDALDKLEINIPDGLAETVLAFDQMFEGLPASDLDVQVNTEAYLDAFESLQSVLQASNAEVNTLIKRAANSNLENTQLKNLLEDVNSLMQSHGMALDKALKISAATAADIAALTHYLGTIQQSAQSTPFGVLGTPAVAPESDVVAMMEANPEMSGQEAVKKLWSVLQERGNFPQKAFYGKLLQMTSKVLGDNIKVKYVTPQTAPDEVLASPTTESRGWYVVNNGTIYVLSPEFAASGLTAELLVHELVHAALEHLIENPSTAAQKQAVQELEALLKEAKKYTQANKITKFNDALSNVHELVAWGMSNAEFQAEVLNRITMPETTQSNRVVEGLKKFIDSLVKLMFPDMAKPEKGFVSGFASLVGNTAALYREAGKQQSKKVDRAVEEANRIYSMATGNNNNQPNAQQIQKYTTEQVFASLGAMSPGLSSDFVLKLQERLNDVVNAFHGPFGAIKAEMEQRVGSTALDAWANAMARGERPFHGKVLNAGVKFTAQEGYVAEQIEAVMDELLQDKHAANSMIYKELEKVYLQARDQLKGQIAPELYNFVFIPQKTLGNRSDYMSRFVSLALSHEGFAQSLEFATRKISLDTRGKTFMQRLEILWRAAVDWLSARMTGTYSGQTAGARTEALVRKLVQIEARNKDKISSKNSLLEFVDTFGDKAKDSVDGVRSSIVKATQSNFVRENRFLAVQTAGKVLTAAMRLNAVANGINAFRNSQIKGKHGQAMQLLNYVKGPGQWLNAMSRIATHIQGERKHIMSDVSKAVMSGFKDGGSYLTTAAKKAISAHLLRTGAFYLLDKFKPSGIQTLLEDSKALDQAIQDEIGLLSSFPEVHYYIAQAKGLAWKQVTGWAGVEEQNLNAHNIARLYNTGNPLPAHAKDAQPTIERLIALYGLQYAKQEDSLGVSTLLDVMRTENARGAENGIEMVLATHRHLINDAKERIFKDSEALMIHGYLPEVTNPHIAFEVVRDDDEAQALIEQGYVFEMAIALDPHDPDKRIPRMYVLNGGGLPRWASGAFSTTGTNAKGKTKHGKYFNSNDPIGVENMQSMNAIHADKKQAVLNQFKPNPGFKPSREQNRLVPLLNAEGKKVDYRYTMKEVYRDKILERNNDFDHLLGVLASSTYDKEASSEQNAKLVEALHGHYRKDFGRNPQNYVLIGKDSEDPELKEIWDLLPKNTKRDVKAQWGMAGMRVPKEMVTPLFGYRKATIADAFKKDHRNALEQGFVDAFNKDPRKALEQGFVDVVHMLMRLNGMRKGMNHVQQRIYQRKAYAKVRKFEDAWEEIVREIKDTIVVKSAVVLWGNMTSNFSVLLMNGLSFKEVIMYQKEALNAVIDYERDRDALAQLQLRLNTAHGAVDTEDLVAEINRLQDAIDRNPAKELIDAGLLPTIVEDVTMEDDTYSYKSQFAHWIDEKVHNLNPSVVGAGRVLYMTHDTTLYKFLHKSTQYSDFVGRYALYRHETTRKRNPLSKEQALFNASESFVNYDIPLPRLLQYLDDHGLMMFTKFFLSIQRVIVRLMTEKPLEVISTVALNNWLFDLPILTDAAAIVRVGNNPLSAGALGYPGTLDDLATVSAISGLVR